MRHSLIQFALASTLGLFAAAAQADTVVYDNGSPDHASGNNLGFALQAEDFRLTVQARLTTIEFWTLEAADAYRGSISYEIRWNAGGALGASILQGTAAVTRTATGTYQGLTEYHNSFDLPSPLLMDPNPYWLILHNGGLDNFTDPNEFLWETAAMQPGQLGGAEAFSQGGPFTPNFQEHAFRISAVPEPCPAFALVAGLGVLAALGRRGAAARRRPQ
ncbi:hypothetical protein E4L96_00060 [Massilia arenosa]|uniref:PEP-CTERM sorting domain-containing protein n=1 Tax=Zemynaea arenosa TaxID=2561931 RepID=A0A4Y9SUE1_9BURK|nr:hypothetical protein [Massilia arenosa]TFW30422.1 hypothetical protein E4L96_00060 [Massilia arenosa]